MQMSIYHNNSISIKYNRVCIISCLLIFYSLLYLILTTFNGTYNNWITLFAVIISFNAIINVFVLRKVKYKIISFFVVFLLVLYLFNFGQVFLYGFFPDYKTTKINYLFPESDSIKKALLFCYWIINLYVLGGIYVKKANKQIRTVSRRKYNKITLIFMIVFFPLQLFYIYRLMTLSSSLGYDEALHNGFSGVFVQLASLYLIGFSMLLYGTKHNKKINTIVYILEMFFIVFSMLSGSRIYAVSSALVISLIYFSNKKISARKIMILVFLAFVLMQFVSAISIVRNMNGFDFKLVLQYMLKLENNVLFMFLEEFGCSIYSVILPIEQVPSHVNYGLGISYFSSIPLFMVNIPGLNIQHFMESACFINYLQGTKALGGNIIGELYFNFGFYFSIPIAFVIGIIVGKVSRRMSYLLTIKTYNLSLALITMISFSMIVWIRDYFSVLIRPIIWGSMVIFIFDLIIKNVGGKKNESKN